MEFDIFCSLYIHMNNIKFTCDKLESVKFGFNIFHMFSQVLLNLFTFLINTTNQEVYKILDKQTNKQTDRQTDNNCNLVMRIDRLDGQL